MGVVTAGPDAELFARFVAIAGPAASAGPAQTVNAVKAIPYGRPAERTPAGVLGDWRGTCSTKHALLVRLLSARWPGLCPRVVHRVYRAERGRVRRRHGPRVAAAVPEGGLVDVHRYVVIEVSGEAVVLDVTFPGDQDWDGRSPMAPACGPGTDVPAGVDPDADKRALEAAHCDPAVREPFIAALTGN
ncbi:MAG: hypothetical protein ACRDPT_12865 [Streptomycetales bacterium]